MVEREPEHVGSIWTHPYMLYIWMTVVIFGVLSGIGYIFYTNDLIPNRGTVAP